MLKKIFNLFGYTFTRSKKSTLGFIQSQPDPTVASSSSRSDDGIFASKKGLPIPDDVVTVR